jgi:hypothetical protein
MLFAMLAHVYSAGLIPLDFMNSRYKTSPLSLTDGESPMLPFFSGETHTQLYTVYFVGRTEKERSFWDVYNKEGFWKGKDKDRIELYAKSIERHIKVNAKLYNVFVIALNKAMVKMTTTEEFLPDTNAVYKTYLLTNGEWTEVDSFDIQRTPKNTAAYLMSVLDKTSKNGSPILGDSLVADPNFSSLVNASCAEGLGECVLEKLRTNYNQLFSSGASATFNIDATHKLQFKTYHKKDDVEIHTKVYALLLANNLVSDSILCYEYYNNANTLSCCEQLYYMDIKQAKLWTVWLNYDVESATAEEANVYTIDLKTNRFRRENNRNVESKDTQRPIDNVH